MDKDQFLQLIKKIEDDVASLLYELDTEIVSNQLDKIPDDIKFNAIPLFKKLRAVQKEAKTTYDHVETLSISH